MTERDTVLENHSVLVRDGRILDLLPSAGAALSYAPAAHIDCADHVLMPGLVNTRAGLGHEPMHGGAALRAAHMLRNGTTCFASAGLHPQESLRVATDLGMRALIGIPIAGTASAWAGSPDEYLARALDLRDELRAHPTIATAFAPQDAATISDGLFGRIATLADELDAAVLMTLHESAAEVDESMTRHGRRPIERLQLLGLLTPALIACHMASVDASDRALAQRSGIAIALCPESNLRRGYGAPPVGAWAGSGLRMGLGSGDTAAHAGLDFWSQIKLLALLSQTAGGGGLSAWDTLSVGTRGGAAALGLDTEIGTLETGKWADLCCVRVRTPCRPAVEAAQVADLLVFDGCREIVSDVWVAGRHLVAGGAFTRVDWPTLSARSGEFA